MPSPPTISVVIPVYNANVFLEELHERLVAAVAPLDPDFEIIFVDDCSLDWSWKTIVAMRQQDPRVRGAQLMRNVGQFRALMCGLGLARGELVVTMDDDLQHPPEEIPKLVQAMRANEDLDAVIGAPLRKRHGVLRNLGSWALRRLNHRFFGAPSTLRLGSFRAIRREVAQLMLQNRSVNVTVGPLLLSVTGRLDNVTVEHHPRRMGRTSYGPLRLLKASLDNVCNYSTLPLSLVGSLGLATAGLSFLYGLWVIFKKLFLGVAIQGWASTIVLICFFSGMILFTLWIIGEYLIRIFRETSDERQFLVRKTLGSGED